KDVLLEEDIFKVRMLIFDVENIKYGELENLIVNCQFAIYEFCFEWEDANNITLLGEFSERKEKYQELLNISRYFDDIIENKKSKIIENVIGARSGT
ncbi:MAG: hypothetical protein COA94_08015, partial [Rickettsiales bacterium]